MATRRALAIAEHGATFRGSGRQADPRSAAVVVLAVAVAAVHADGPAIGVGRDHGVHAIGLADAAEVLDGFPGPVAAV